jgi:hypothetical protein
MDHAAARKSMIMITDYGKSSIPDVTPIGRKCMGFLCASQILNLKPVCRYSKRKEEEEKIMNE